MSFQSALMYAEKYKLSEIYKEERDSLSAAVEVARKVIAKGDSAYSRMELAVENKSNEVFQVKIALKSEEGKFETCELALGDMKGKLKKRTIIMGAAIVVITLLSIR